MRFLLTVFIFLASVGIVSAQSDFSFGPSIGFSYNSLGESDYYTIQPKNFNNITFGVASRLSYEKWKIRTDLLYKGFNIELNSDQQVNSVQRQIIETNLRQSAIFIYLGGEYHLNNNPTHPYLGAGLDFGFLLDYEYTVDFCTTNLSGVKTNSSNTTDDSNSGSEYGFYLNGGLTVKNHVNFELRYHIGSRNRSDLSIPVNRLVLLAFYLF